MAKYKPNTVGVRDILDFSPGGKIRGLPNPQRANEAASRGYVEASIAESELRIIEAMRVISPDAAELLAALIHQD
jgi:hypothetical protein